MNDRKKPDPLDRALRSEPDYQDLVRTLKKQTPEERDRLDEWLENEGQKEGNSDVSEEDPETPEKESTIPEEWREPIRQLIREELKAMSAQGGIVPESTERPPTRPKKTKGRGYAGKKRVLPGSNVDKNLFELFNEFRRKHRLSASDAMEAVLWVFFNRPPLSYQSELEQKPQTTLDKPNIDRA